MQTTYLSANTLNASIPAQAIAAAGTAQVTVSSSCMATSNAIPFPIANSKTTFLNIPAFDIVWDDINQVIYAAIPNYAISDSNAIFPNTIAAIDPESGQAKKTVSTGGGVFPPVTGPIFLAISDDCSFLYAFIYESKPEVYGVIKRYILPALTPDTSFSIPFNTTAVSAMRVAPGAPHTIAVALMASGDRNGGVLVFDDAVQRGTGVLTSKDGLPFSYLQWSADGSTLYATNNWRTVGEYMTMSVDSGGLTIQTDSAGILSAGSHDIHLIPSTGKIYVGNGQIIDPVTGNTLGTCGSGWDGMAPDPTLGIAFFLDLHPPQSNDWPCFALHSYDLTRFSSLSTMTVPIINVPNSSGYYPNRIIRCGTAMLAVGGGGTPICLVTGPFAQGK